MLKNDMSSNSIIKNKETLLWAGVFLLFFSIVLTFWGVKQLEMTIRQQEHLLEVQRHLSQFNDSIRNLSLARQQFKTEMDMDNFLKLQKSESDLPENFLKLQQLLQGDQRFHYMIKDLQKFYLNIINTSDIDYELQGLEQLTRISQKIQFILNDDIFLARPSTLQTLDFINIFMAIVSSVALFFILYAWFIIRRSEKFASKALEMKSQFLAMVSHEIRTPLNGIISMSDFLRQKEISFKERKVVDVLYHSGISLRRLINDLLDFSKMEAGKLIVENNEIQFKTFIEDTLEVLKIKALNKKIIFTLQIDPQIPNILVGDSGKMAQILLNLVNNAIKFTSAGHIQIEVNLKLIIHEKYIIRFVVSDTGCGIHSDDFPLLFEPFNTLRKISNNSELGTGLGLSISKKLVDILGGTINCSSKLGVGSEFSFEIPLLLSKKVMSHLPELESVNINQIPRGNILVVEDNSTNQLIAQILLEKAGQHVYIASNGIEAIKLLENLSIELILMDLQMPILDGIETARRIRNGIYQNQIPIIAMTANAFENEKQKSYSAGMNDYLTKPFVLQDLLLILNKFLPKEINPNEKIHSLIRDLGYEATFEILNSYEKGLEKLYHTFLEADLNSFRAKELSHQFKSSSATLGFSQLTKYFEIIDEGSVFNLEKKVVITEIESILEVLKRLQENVIRN